MTIRFSLLLLTAALTASCAAPPIAALPAPVAAAPAREAIAPSLSVAGVSPPVAGRDGRYRFMVRPATSEVMRIDDASNMAAWGSLGGAPGKLNHPESLYAANGRVYVADTGNHRIQIFDPDGKLVGGFGAFGNREGQFTSPRSVEVFSGGLVAVVDDYRIQYFDGDGGFVGQLSLNPTVAPGTRTLKAGSPITYVEADIQAFMVLFQKLTQEARDEARSARAKQVQAQVAELQDAAAKMAKAANTRFASAVVAGTLQLAAGQTEAIGGKVASTGAAKGAEAMSKTGRATESKLSRPIGGLATTMNGTRPLGGGVAGSGTTLNGKGAGADAEMAADKARLEAEAKVHESREQDASEVMQQMLDVIRDIRDKLAAIEQSSVETNRGIARNI